MPALLQVRQYSVCAGITNNIDRRRVEHKKEPGHAKGHVKQIGLRIRYDHALEWRNEQEKLGKPIFKQRR